MKDITFVVWGAFASMLIALSGLVFCAFILSDVYLNQGVLIGECIYSQGKEHVLYIGLSTGLSVAMAGALLAMMLLRLRKNEFLIVPIRVVAVFLFVAGILAVFYMYMNVWSWILFLLSAIMLGVSLSIKKWMNRINTKEPYND